MPLIPSQGLSLWQCIKSLPCMSEYRSGLGLTPSCVRGHITAEVRMGEKWSETLTILLHPSPLVGSVLDRVLVDANWVNGIFFHEILSGARIQIPQNWVSGRCRMTLPASTAYNAGELRFICDVDCLNEFGLFYVALFIAGNYARYFPDRWLLDIERSMPLAMVIEELCAAAQHRVPFLTLRELDQTLYAFED
jgi:hypothetical protein